MLSLLGNDIERDALISVSYFMLVLQCHLIMKRKEGKSWFDKFIFHQNLWIESWLKSGLTWLLLIGQG